jgi:hypothetical protein
MSLMGSPFFKMQLREACAHHLKTSRSIETRAGIAKA